MLRLLAQRTQSTASAPQPPSPLATPPLPAAIPAKLVAGQANDPLEQEADCVADQVMRMPAPEIEPAATPPQISRQCAPCEAAEEELQKKEAGTSDATLGEASASVDEVLRSSGQPLDAASRAFFEPRLGHDFSRVRIHADPTATLSARSLAAHAYTVGTHVVFGAGQYEPSTNSGRHLLAHELTHVVQQHASGAPAIQRESDNTDTTACTLTANYSVGLAFLNGPDSMWTQDRKNDFIKAAKSLIESEFNGNTFHIVPAVASYGHDLFGFRYWTTTCPCNPGGLAPQIAINAYETDLNSRSDDWNAMVRSNPSGDYIRSHQDPEARLGDLNEHDVQLENGLYPVVHEFGHSIGLLHPGSGIAGIAPNSPQEYAYSGLDVQGRTVGPTDLMGKGMGLRVFYFDRWLNNMTTNYPGCNYVLK
jgi:hypothetical protein